MSAGAPPPADARQPPERPLDPDLAAVIDALAIAAARADVAGSAGTADAGTERPDPVAGRGGVR